MAKTLFQPLNDKINYLLQSCTTTVSNWDIILETDCSKPHEEKQSELIDEGILQQRLTVQNPHEEKQSELIDEVF